MISRGIWEIPVSRARRISRKFFNMLNVNVFVCLLVFLSECQEAVKNMFREM